MKHLRDQAKSGMAAKINRRSGGDDTKRVMKGMPSRDDETKGYATGGVVDAGPIEGMTAKPNIARPGRKMPSMKAKPAAKKGGTNVNVIVMPKGDAPAPAPTPKPEMPMAGPPPAMPPMPGPGPGGPPPMPMRKDGGRVARMHGGRVDLDAGAGGGKGRIEKAKAYGSTPGKAVK